ncbi:uncharacterized protein LOC127749601 [Frankliniella occidentalis]|uniref:Uncharacterized protein LOC127749601 n=1 Tax=Frankliniella occidentalis TaxID=133901 RepID=A0A9C6X070_FRAOC|nr:uncharacterized protein LOC127749601 [Frankliniella occidentalis]
MDPLESPNRRRVKEEGDKENHIPAPPKVLKTESLDCHPPTPQLPMLSPSGESRKKSVHAMRSQAKHSEKVHEQFSSILNTLGNSIRNRMEQPAGPSGMDLQVAVDWFKNRIKPLRGTVTIFHVEDSIPVNTSSDLGLKSCLRCQHEPLDKERKGVAVWGPGENLETTLRIFAHYNHLYRWKTKRSEEVVVKAAAFDHSPATVSTAHHHKENFKCGSEQSPHNWLDTSHSTRALIEGWITPLPPCTLRSVLKWFEEHDGDGLNEDERSKYQLDGESWKEPAFDKIELNPESGVWIQKEALERLKDTASFAARDGQTVLFCSLLKELLQENNILNILPSYVDKQVLHTTMRYVNGRYKKWNVAKYCNVLYNARGYEKRKRKAGEAFQDDEDESQNPSQGKRPRKILKAKSTSKKTREQTAPSLSKSETAPTSPTTIEQAPTSHTRETPAPTSPAITSQPSVGSLPSASPSLPQHIPMHLPPI